MLLHYNVLYNSILEFITLHMPGRGRHRNRPRNPRLGLRRPSRLRDKAEAACRGGTRQALEIGFLAQASVNLRTASKKETKEPRTPKSLTNRFPVLKQKLLAGVVWIGKCEP